jgi:hypothetical protein
MGERDPTISKYLQITIQDRVNLTDKDNIKRNDFMRLTIQNMNHSNIEEEHSNLERMGMET